MVNQVVLNGEHNAALVLPQVLIIIIESHKESARSPCLEPLAHVHVAVETGMMVVEI
jgi:hypothetical protein